MAIRKSQYGKEEVNTLYAKLPKDFPHPYHGFLSLGLSPEEYHREVFDKVDPTLFLDEDDLLVNLFTRIYVAKLIITLASLSYSESLQQRLGVYDLVERTISTIEHPPTYSKLEAYESIRKHLGINANKICVIGDNFSADILSAVENGFKTFLLIIQEFYQLNFIVLISFIAYKTTYNKNSIFYLELPLSLI